MASEELNRPDLRWTLDEPDDLEFFKAVSKNFKLKLVHLCSQDLIYWLDENPNISEINADVKQKNIEDG